MKRFIANKDLQSHKKCDKVKWIITAVILLLVSILLVSVCMQVWAKDEYKPSNWGKGLSNEHNEDLPATNESAFGGLVVTPNENNNEMISLCSSPISVSAISMNGYRVNRESSLADSVTISATVKPDYAKDKSVTWSMKWKNGSSSWASGKTVTDYVSLSSTTDMEITVSSKSAFAEPIILTVTANSNTDITNSVTINYEKRVEDIRLNLGGGYPVGLTTDIILNSTDDASTLLEFNDISTYAGATWGYGTLDANGTVSAKIQYTNTEYLTEMCSALNSVQGGLSYDSSMGAEYDKGFVLTDRNFWFAFLAIGGKGGYNALVAQQMSRFQNAAMNVLQRYENVNIAELTIKITCNSATYTKVFGIKYSSTALTFVADNVNVSQSNITF